jgi:hypothetical protein
MEGWILVHRRVCDHPFFKERRVFSRFEAWLYLLFRANHKDHRFLLGSEMVEAKRGEVITSELTLMEDWRWSKSKVRRYIKNLEDERMVVKKADSKKTTLFIINYDAYQRIKTTEEPQKDRRETAERPQKIHNQINRKNEKNVKEKKETPLPPSEGETPYPSKEKVSDDWNREVELDPNRVPGYSEDGTVCFIPETPDDYQNLFQYLVKSWNHFLADVGRPAGEEKVGLSPVEITPERMALIKARVKEWPDFYMRWISVIGYIWHSPFMLGENKDGWKANFDWVLKPGVARRICEENLDQMNVLKSLRAMDEELLPGLQLAEVPASSLGGIGSEGPREEKNPEGSTEPAEKPETPGEELHKDPLPPKIPVEEVLPKETRIEINRRGASQFLESLESLNKKRPAEETSSSPTNGNGADPLGADAPEDEEFFLRNQLSEPQDVAEGMDDSAF